PLMLTLLLIAVVGGFKAVDSAHLMAGVSRFFTPWIATIYPTDTHIHLAEGDIVVKEGEGLSIAATLSGIVPATAELALRTGDGEPRLHVLNVTDDAVAYPIKTTHRSFDYQIVAGDAESAWHKVTVISAPRIVQVNNTITFPEYTLRADESLETLTLTVPEGSSITWRFMLDRAIKEGQFLCEGEEPIVLEVSADGVSVMMSYQAKSSSAYRFSWIEKENGYAFQSPRHFIQVMPDRPPTLELAEPDRNQMATLNRQLGLAINARDDHGIAKAEILYRVNDSEESRLTFPLTKVEQGQRQRYTWAYQQNVDDLKVGDRIRFAVEVADRYPGEQGPYVTRSEWRTITFLSEEDYLAYVAKIKTRLLSQLRGLYRQERQAYTAVDAFGRDDDNFQQSVTLEGMRQDIVSEHVLRLAHEIALIIDDLNANQIADEQEKAELAQLITLLKTIAEQHVQAASVALRDLADPANRNADTHIQTLRHINSASREIASIVLGLGVSFASEVFSRELHAAIHDQTIMRLESMAVETADNAVLTALSGRQKNLAQWITRLLDEMNKNQDYVNRPLLSIRLSRVVAGLEKDGVDGLMNESAALLDKGEATAAATSQEKVITLLSSAHYRIQASAEAMDLIRARDLLLLLEGMQQEIRDQEIDDPANVARKQQSLITKLRPLLIPDIPPARSMIVDLEPNLAPDIEGMQSSMRAAIAKAKSDDDMQEAQNSIRALSRVLEQRVSEKMQFGRLYKMYMTAYGRVSLIENLHVRQISILEKIEDAAAEEESCVGLAASQEGLLKELKSAGRAIEKAQERAKYPSKFELGVLDAFDRAASLIEQSVVEIKKNDPFAVIDLQEQVLTVLEEAKDTSTQEGESLGGLVLMMMAATNMEIPRGHLADIVAVQGNLMATTAKTAGDEAVALVPPQTRLSAGVYEVSSTLDSANEDLNLEQAFTFAGSALGSAVLRLEEKNPSAALAQQKMSMRMIDNIGEQLKAFETRNGYLADVLEYVQQRVADNVEIAVIQGQLVSEIDFHEDRALATFVERQKVLLEKATGYAAILKTGTGDERYLGAASHMEKALTYMAADNRPKALREAELSLVALEKDRDILMDKLVRLGLIPGVMEVEASDEVKTLLEAIAVVANQNILCREMWRAGEEEKEEMGETQLDLKDDLQDLVEMSNKHTAVVAAQSHVSNAVDSVQDAEWEQAYTHQRETGTSLLHFVLEYCHHVPIPGVFSSKKPKAPLLSKGDPELLQTTEDLQVFAKMAVDGELPKDKRSEWEVLGSRDRAALNENFARELPLEYRELLKDYYERLAR
ncbi:MAG: hypothetical protein ACI8W8_001498, partial [Rhodothermales bacterium]